LTRRVKIRYARRVFISLHLGNEIPAFRPRARHLARLRRAFPGASLRDCAGEADFLDALPEATHALVWNFRAERLARAPRLRHIATPAAGRDWVEPAATAGLRTTFGSFHGPLIAQTLLGQLLAFNRGILDAARLARGGHLWPRRELAARCRDVRGTRAVLLGFGNVGQAVGMGLKSLGIRVTGIRRDVSQPAPGWFTRGDRVLPISELDRVLPSADHLVCALPATPETRLLLDARRLALLPRRAAVYNVGRGNVLDEDALARLLEDGLLRGALLDVFQSEPLSAGSPLRSAPNFHPLPHASAIAPNYLDLWLDELIPKLP